MDKHDQSRMRRQDRLHDEWWELRKHASYGNEPPDPTASDVVDDLEIELWLKGSQTLFKFYNRNSAPAGGIIRNLSWSTLVPTSAVKRAIGRSKGRLETLLAWAAGNSARADSPKLRAAATPQAFTVKGKDRASGFDTSVRVNAIGWDGAASEAESRGVAVWSVERFVEPPPGA